LPIFRIAQHGNKYFIELKVAAARVGESAHRFLVGLAEVVKETVWFWISLFVDWCAYRPTISRRGCGNRNLWRAPGTRRYKLEVLDHRMAGKPDPSRYL